ncbi:hypothetical protein CIK68_17620 [Brachybacterium alimentarium]|nr:hypothetical protein CIK68_17620 [Brachybacterium alimentarium]
MEATADQAVRAEPGGPGGRSAPGGPSAPGGTCGPSAPGGPGGTGEPSGPAGRRAWRARSSGWHGRRPAHHGPGPPPLREGPDPTWGVDSGRGAITDRWSTTDRRRRPAVRRPGARSCRPGCRPDGQPHPCAGR